VRSVVFTFEDLAEFRGALGSFDPELPLRGAATLGEGEWMLAIFEIGTGRRATAAAGRAYERAGGQWVIGFERRDWERLLNFCDPESRASGSAAAAECAVEEPDEQRGAPVEAEDAPPTKRDSVTLLSSVALTASGHHAATNARVLLVDDDPGICEVVTAMLEAVGLKVATASSAEEALERVKARQVELVVLDWNLPGMTGLELCKQIRREPDLGSLPVLFLTANTSQKDLVDAFASGADDYVLKPFRAPELGARIFGLLRRARKMAL
jgi:two-component system phosphate regulon response regulator PhoB